MKPSATSESRRSARRWRLESLERRVLFSADLPFASLLFDHETRLESVVGSSVIAEQAVESTTTASLNLVVLDPSAAQFEPLREQLGSLDEDRWRGFVLDAAADGIAQLSDILAGQRNVGAVHVLTSGSSDGMILGNGPVTLVDVLAEADAVAGWRDSLGDDATFQVFGLDDASRQASGNLLATLSDLVGAEAIATTSPPALPAMPDTPGPVRDGAAAGEDSRYQRLELVFVDPDTPDYQALLDDLTGSEDASRCFEVMVLDAERDGVEQIGEVLASYAGVDAVHVISHGAPGSIELGSTRLSSETLANHRANLAGWAEHLDESADLMVYGCNLAATAEGQQLVGALAALTGADVAASDDLTGSAALGGDWDLEYQSGAIETALAPSAAAQAAWAGTLAGDAGTAVFSDGSTTPQSSDWDGSGFSVAGGTASLPDNYRILQGADAPTRDEQIVVGIDASGNVTGMISDGASWTALPLSMGTVSETYWWGAEVAYEQQSGDAVVVWNDNSQAVGSKLRYAVWDGSSWSSAQSIAAYSGAEPQNLRLAFDPRSDAMVLVVDDVNADDFALVWNGSSWGNAITLDTSGSGESDQSAIAVSFEAQSGDAMVTYGKSGDSNVYHRTWNGTAWEAESSLSPPAGVSGSTRWITSATDYGSDRVAVGVMTSLGEVWLAVWDGSAWESSMLAETGSTGTVYPNVAVAFEGASGEAIATYGEGTQQAFRYRTWDATSGWSAELTGPSLGDVPNSMTLASSPDSDQIMLAVQDNASDVHYLRWDGSAWGSDNELTTTSGETKNQPFLFIYDQDGMLVDPNDSPFNSVPGVQATAVDAAVVFSVANGNAISVTDADDPTLEVTLSAGNGLVTLNGTTGLSFTVGDGTSDATVTFSGSVTDINAALDGLQFDPTLGFEGYASLQITTTDFAASGGSPMTDDDTVVIEVGDVNDAPTVTLPGSQSLQQDGLLVFSTTTGTGISVSDFDAGGSAIEVTLTASNGTVTLSGTNGLTFSTGDGSNDAVMTFTGTLTDINAALEGSTFLAASGFTGAASLQVDVDDLGNSGSGGAQTVSDSVAITVQAVDQSLWMTFENDEGSTGNPDIPSFTGGDVVTYDATQLETSNSNPLAATTSGTFSATFNLDTVVLSDGVTLASDGNTRVNAIHRVASDMVVGGIQLRAGDLLLSTNEAETLGGVAYDKEDVFVFRPDTDGDYSQGSFFRLIDGKNDMGWSNVSAISLVEQSTVVGGVTLNAGDFLVAHDGSGKNILRFAPTSLGDTTSGTTSVLVAGADIDIGTNIGGLHLVQNDTVLGGVSLTAGQLLVSLVTDDAAVGDGTTINVHRQDVFVLDVTATGTGTSAATASRLFEGLDESLDVNNESIWGISLESNAAPEISDTTFSLDENSAAATVVGTVSATDPEGGSVRYAITAGNTGGAFAIDAATGQITVANSTALDYETTPSFALTVAAVDAQGAYSNATVTVDLNDVPEAPVFTSPATFSLSENGTAVGTVTTTDPDGGAPQYTLVGSDDDALFSIDVNTGALGFNTAPDFEAPADGDGDNVYQLTVQADDGNGGTATQVVTVTVTNVNEFSVGTPIDADGTGNSVAESAAVGAPVGITAFADDADAPDAVTYSLDDDAGGLFVIDSATGVLTVNGTLDYETATSHAVTVRATSSDGSFATQSFSIDVTDVNEFAISAISDIDAVANAVVEDAAVGVAVGVTAFADDADGSDTVTYSLDDDAGGLFAVDSATGVVTVNGALDHETATSHAITVRATSTDGSFQTLGISIDVTDANDVAPVITPAQSFSVDEDAGSGASVGTVTATDPDTVGSLQGWTITAGNGDGVFAIDSTTGEITVADPANLDYETTSQYTLTVQVGDGVNTSATETVVIDVQDVNEAAVGSISDADASADTVAEDAAVGTAVGVTAFADDADGTDTVSYSLDDDAGGLFAIDSATGVVTLNGALDAETATSHNVTIRATSTDGSFSTTTLAITVSDVDEFDVGTVSDADAAANSVNEDAAIGTAVALTALADDADVSDAVAYTLDDDAGGLFAVDSATGVVTVNGALDYETATSHSVTVRATSTDGSFSTQSFTIAVVDVNESGVGAISDADAATDSVAEDAAIGTAVGVTASADDPDGTDTVIYSLDDSAGGLFAIDSATGVVTVNGALDAETATSHDITIRATSTDGSFSTTTLSISVSDVDEFDVGTVTDSDAVANSVNEDAAVGTAVGLTASASDADVGDSVTYSLDDDAGGLFAVDSVTGVVTVDGALDYETATSHSVTVRATSTDGSFSTQSFSIDVVDVNESPIGAVSDADAATNTVAEDAVVGTVVGVTAFANDADGTDTVTYSLDDDAGGLFAIDSTTGVITVNGGLDAETAISHDVTIRATSTDGSFSTTTLAIAVSDVDEFDVGIVTDTDGAANSVAEGATVGTAVGVTATASDADVGDSVTYSLDDDAGGLFAIDSATGVVTVNGALDYETATSHAVTVRATSTDGSFSTQTFTIDVTDVNESSVGAISDTDGAMDTVAEDATVGSSVGVTAFADDADGTDTVSYSLDDDAAGLFAIDGATGVVTVNGALDAENAISHDITIRATSTDGSFSTTTLSISVTDVDEFDVGTVTDADAAENSVNEDAAVGTAVGLTASASDADVGDSVTYSLDDDAGGLFAIDSATGVVTVNGALDYETAISHSVTVRATSTDGSFSTQSFTIDVVDVNESGIGAISDMDAAADLVAEDAAVGTAVGVTAFADDPDATDIVSYALDDDAGGLFAIDSTTGIVTVNGALDAEAASSHDITIRATSTDGSFTTTTLTIAVTDIDEFDVGAVTDADGTANSVAEDAATGATVGVTALADDADVTDTVTYTLDDDAGGLFAIDSATGVVTVNGALDYETATSHAVTVRATSTDGSFSTQVFTIDVVDVNESGVGPISDADAAADGVAEDAMVGSSVGVTASADDPDGTDTVSYSLDDNAGGLFSIGSATGVVTVNGALDAETATSHDITIRATSTDGSFSTTTLSISVTDVDEFDVSGISDTDGAVNQVQEDAALGTVVGLTAFAEDSDITDAVTYSLDDDAGGLFAIDSATGVVTVNGALDYETAASHAVTVRATSTDGSFSTQVFTIDVVDVNESGVGPISDTDASADAVAEDAAVGTTVGVTVFADDADGTDTVSYSLDDDAGGLFAIDGATGAVTVNGALDAETATSHNVTIRATSTDGSFSTTTLNIAVTDVDEFDVGAVTDAAAAANSVNEDAAVGTAVGLTALASDADVDDSVTYSLDDDAGGLFAIDAASGDVTLVGALDFETAGSHDITVRATSDDGSSVTRSFTILVGDLNDTAPTIVAGQTFSVNEDAAMGTAVGAVAAADPDTVGSLQGWVITGGNADGVFAIDGATGAITIADPSTLDAEATSQYTLNVQVGDGINTSAIETVVIDVQNVNEPPVFTSTPSFVVAEGTTAVGTVTSTDPEGDAPQYALVGSVDDALFSIDAATGALSFNAAPDYEMPADWNGDNVYDLVVQVSDGNGGTATQAVSVSVTDSNDQLPVITPGQTFSVAEDASAGAVVGTVAATDTDTVGGLQGWTITAGNAAGVFAIDAATGELTIADPANLNYESTNRYTLTIQVGDGSNVSAAETVVVDVVDVNEPPGPVMIDNAMVTESVDTTGGYRVGYLSALDPDAGDVLSFAVVGGLDADVFTIGGVAGDELIIDDGVLDPLRQPGYDVRIRVTDAAGAWSERTITVAVTDGNQPPVGVDDALVTSEDVPLTIALADLLGNDLDPEGDALTVVGMEQPGKGVLMDNLDGTWTYLPDQDYAGSDQFRYQVSDASGATAWASVDITVRPVNDAPVLAMTGSASVVENAGGAATVVEGSDVDGDPVTLSLSGADRALFDLDPATGEVRFASAPDFEQPLDADGDNRYELTVTAADPAGATVSLPLVVTVVDANEAPVLGTSAFTGVQGVAGTIGTLSVSDPDAGDSLAISIVGGTGAGLFAIDPDSGEIAQTGDAAPGVYSIDVLISDGRGGTATGTLNIRLDPLETVLSAGGAEPAPTATPPGAELSVPPAGEGSAAGPGTVGSARAETGETEPEAVAVSGPAGVTPGDHGQMISVHVAPPARLDAPVVPEGSTGSSQAPSNQSSGVTSGTHNLVLELLLEETDELVEAALSGIFGGFEASGVSVTLSPAMLNALDQMRDAVDQAEQAADREHLLLVSAGTATTLTLTAGFVTWLVRSGLLLSTLMSTAPVWRQFDPIPVLAPMVGGGPDVGVESDDEG